MVDNTGYTIDTSGVYKMISNITTSAPIAITITTNNIVLDLNGFTLSGDPVSNQIGILVRGSNITIKNGTVQLFSLNGIKVTDSDIISLEHLTIINNGSSVYDTTVGISAGAAIYNSSSIRVLHSRFDKNYGIGLGCGNISNIYIDHCHFDTNMGSKTGLGIFTYAVFGLAIMIEAGTLFGGTDMGIHIYNSTANNNNAPLTVIGISIIDFSNPPSISDVVLENVVVSNNYTDPTTAQVGGLGVTEGISIAARNTVVKNCISSNIYTSITPSITNHVVGIEVTGYDVFVEDCQVSNISGSSQRMTGFDLETFGTNATFKNCKASNIVNSSNSTDSFCYGFGLEVPIILGGSLSNFGTDALGTGLIVEKCIAQGVSGGIISAGFDISSENNFLVKDSISSNNKGNGFQIHDYFTYPSVGDYPTRNGIFDNNYAYDNGGYGFLDNINTRDAYIKNKSRDNKHGNYFGLPSGNLIVDWNPCKPISTSVPSSALSDAIINLSIRCST